MTGWHGAVHSAQRDPATVRPAVKAVLAELSDRAPGRSVEVRVPPHGAVQIVAGPPHRRGTPKATVELTAEVLFALALGVRDWQDAVTSGDVIASGERTDLSALFPLTDTVPNPATP